VNVALRPDSLNLISLCTGGGGLDLGIELAMPGARSVVLVEREAFAAGHLVAAMQQGLLGQAPVWSDVTTFNGRPWRGLVDGLIGGIPCQPHSLAGKRLGEEDERDLWSDARRVIVQSGVWFVLIENVRGMLSSGGAERVWRDLLRLGCSVEVGLFTASEVGAPHERERVFILAVADAGCERNERWGGPRDVLCAPSSVEGQGHQRERHGDAANDRSDNLADPQGEQRRGEFQPQGARCGRSRSEGCGGELAYADDAGLAIRQQPEDERGYLRHQGTSVAQSGDGMGNAIVSGYHWRADDAIRGSIGRAASQGAGRELGIFPPGPSDLHSWRHILERAPELEPAFRRVADGLASRLDTARVDRLRLLGNGVVSLQAAYAICTLATRLAASGSVGAARLVRMMALSFPSQKFGAAENAGE
jgi:DNA (cytosine-5)-methyltransferase 1